MEAQIGFQPIKSCVNIGETLYVNIDIMLSTYVYPALRRSFHRNTEIKLAHTTAPKSNMKNANHYYRAIMLLIISALLPQKKCRVYLVAMI